LPEPRPALRLRRLSPVRTPPASGAGPVSRSAFLLQPVACPSHAGQAKARADQLAAQPAGVYFDVVLARACPFFRPEVLRDQAATRRRWMTPHQQLQKRKLDRRPPHLPPAGRP